MIRQSSMQFQTHCYRPQTA